MPPFFASKIFFLVYSNLWTSGETLYRLLTRTGRVDRFNGPFATEGLPCTHCRLAGICSNRRQRQVLLLSVLFVRESFFLVNKPAWKGWDESPWAKIRASDTEAEAASKRAIQFWLKPFRVGSRCCGSAELFSHCIFLRSKGSSGNFFRKYKFIFTTIDVPSILYWRWLIKKTGTCREKVVVIVCCIAVLVVRFFLSHYYHTNWNHGGITISLGRSIGRHPTPRENSRQHGKPDEFGHGKGWPAPSSTRWVAQSIDWLIDCSVDQLIDWLIVRSIDWLIDLLFWPSPLRFSIDWLFID